jgi:hypothetical protein
VNSSSIKFAPLCFNKSYFFQSIGLNIFTNAKVNKPLFCQPPVPHRGLIPGYGAGEYGIGAGKGLIYLSATIIGKSDALLGWGGKNDFSIHWFS